MNGWKTNAGAVVAAVSQLLVAFNVLTPEVGEAITTIGGALAAAGIGSKLQRILDK